MAGKTFTDVSIFNINEHVALAKRICSAAFQIEHYIHEMHAKKCKQSTRAKRGFAPLCSRDKKIYRHLKHKEFFGHLNCWFEELMFYYDRFKRKTPVDIYYSNAERFGTYERNSFTFESLSSTKTLSVADAAIIMSTIDDVLELYDFLINALRRCVTGMDNLANPQKDHFRYAISSALKQRSRLCALRDLLRVKRSMTSHRAKLSASP